MLPQQNVLLGRKSSNAVPTLQPREKHIQRIDMNGIQKLPSFHLLHVAGQRADNLFAGQNSSVTPRQYVVLAVLEGRQDASQTDIVRATGIDRSTIADLVKRLVAAGYLQRTRSKDDGRAYAVGLTDTGQEVLDANRSAAALADERLFAPVAASRRVQFLEDLTRVAEGAGLSED
jgi:DNA-binding MarR family transcriptional regulator